MLTKELKERLIKLTEMYETSSTLLEDHESVIKPGFKVISAQLCVIMTQLDALIYMNCEKLIKEGEKQCQD
jgi:hypothetical protein